VKVEATDEGLVIQGERRREHTSEEAAWRHSERVYGRFYRLIPLPESAKLEETKANFRNGVLEVVVPVPSWSGNTSRFRWAPRTNRLFRSRARSLKGVPGAPLRGVNKRCHLTPTSSLHTAYILYIERERRLEPSTTFISPEVALLARPSRSASASPDNSIGSSGPPESACVSAPASAPGQLLPITPFRKFAFCLFELGAPAAEISRLDSAHIPFPSDARPPSSEVVLAPALSLESQAFNQWPPLFTSFSKGRQIRMGSPGCCPIAALLRENPS